MTETAWMRNRVKILFIAGSGRTASTLLSLLLSQHRTIFNLGQIRDLESAWLADAPCSCGHAVQVCPFWSQLIHRLYGDDPADFLTTNRERFKAFQTDARDPACFWNRKFTARLQAKHSDLVEDMEAGVMIAAALANTDTLIDSSKSPERALALSFSARVDLRILYLVRDPRAVACSWALKTGRVEQAVHYAKAWKRRDAQLRAMARAMNQRFKILRYEDFAAAPRTQFERVRTWAQLPADLDPFIDPSTALIDWQDQHLFPPANERLLEERPQVVTIRPAMGWLDKAHRRTRMLATRHTFPAGLRHGYGVF